MKYIYLAVCLYGESYDVISVTSSYKKAVDSSTIFLKMREHIDADSIIWKYKPVKTTAVIKKLWFAYNHKTNDPWPLIEVCRVQVNNPYFFSFVKEEN